MLTRFSLRRIVGTVGVLALVLGTVTSSAVETQEINWTRMERDLEIMEGVLSKLLSTPEQTWGPWSGKAYGVYFEGYGVVFLVDYGHLPVLTLRHYEQLSRETMARLHKAQEKLVQAQEKLEAAGTPSRIAIMGSTKEPALEWQAELKGEEEKVSLEERIEALKGQITEFLGSYADAIGQVDSTDHVTVLVYLGNGSRAWVSSSLAGDGHEPLSLLEVTAKKEDIIAYRRGRIHEEEFGQRVVFHRRLQDDAMTVNVDIMASIMDTALGRKHHPEFGSEGDTRGFYLEGLGTVFFMQGRLNRPVIYGITGDSARIGLAVPEKALAEAHRVSKKRDEGLEEAKENFRNKLIEIVGDYGHIIRTLKPTDYVVVAVDFTRGGYGFVGMSTSDPGRFIMRVKKEDLDGYDRGDLDRAALRKRVEFLEF